MHALKPHIQILLLLICIAAPAANAITVVDDMGHNTTLASPPQRIVSLAPSNTEILYALGLNDRVVGVTDYCNYPPEAQEKPKVGGYSSVSIERVIALQPDLILAAYGNGESVIAQLRNLGYPVVALHPSTLDDVIRNIKLVGSATGAEENAGALVEEMERRIRRVEERAAKAGVHPRVAHVIWSDPIYVSGSGTFQDELITRAGGVNAFSHLEGWKAVGIEEFIHADPEVLIVNRGTGMGGGEDAIARYFLEEPRFSNVTAIREGRVHLVDSDTVDRAGPRIVDALELVADAILLGNAGGGDLASVTAGATPAAGGHVGIEAFACGLALLLVCRCARGRIP